MFTRLSEGDKIHVGDSVTLTLLATEGDLIQFGIESSEADDTGPSVLIDVRNESDRNWCELN